MPARCTHRMPAFSAATLIALLTVSGCVDEDNRCGSYIFVDGGCQKPVDAPADTSGTLDGGGNDGGFGDPCHNASQCQSDATYCAVDPSSGNGLCTVKDCDPAHDTCPTGWKCWDGPKYYGSLVPTMCLPLDQWQKLSP